MTKDDAFLNFLSFHPIHTYYKRKALTTARFTILNHYYSYSGGTTDHVASSPNVNQDILPPGWTFRCPVPLPSEPFHMDKADWSPILEFRAERMRLYLGERAYEMGDCASGHIENAEGQIVGGIRLNLEEWPEKTQCELINISRAEAIYNKTPTFAEDLFPELRNESFHTRLQNERAGRIARLLETCDNSGQESLAYEEHVYRFYNVLWIEWNNSIAYRLALGRVEQGFWDSAIREEVDVRLG